MRQRKCSIKRLNASLLLSRMSETLQGLFTGLSRRFVHLLPWIALPKGCLGCKPWVRLAFLPRYTHTLTLCAEPKFDMNSPWLKSHSLSVYTFLHNIHCAVHSQSQNYTHNSQQIIHTLTSLHNSYTVDLGYSRGQYGIAISLLALLWASTKWHCM